MVKLAYPIPRLREEQNRQREAIMRRRRNQRAKVVAEMRESGASDAEIAAAEAEMDLEDQQLLADLSAAFELRQDGPLRALAAAQQESMTRAASNVLKGREGTANSLAKTQISATTRTTKNLAMIK